MAFLHVLLGDCIDEKIALFVKVHLKLICQSKRYFFIGASSEEMDIGSSGI